MAEEVKKDEKELEKKTAESNFEEEDSGASQVKKLIYLTSCLQIITNC